MQRCSVGCVGVAFFEGCTHIGKGGNAQSYASGDWLRQVFARCSVHRSSEARVLRNIGWIGHRNIGAHCEMGELERALQIRWFGKGSVTNVSVVDVESEVREGS